LQFEPGIEENFMRTTTSLRLSTGIQGLDEILHGGFLPGRSWLVTGQPGAGKTTLGLHFVAAGAAGGDRPLLVCVDEPEEHIRSDADALGISMEGVTFLDLTPDATVFAESQSYDIFSPFEVEREPVAKEIAARIDATKTRRIFVDGFAEFQRLAGDPLQFRRLIQSFLRLAAERHATLLLNSADSDVNRNYELAAAVDGVIALGSTVRGRFLQIKKFRGSDYEAGYHPIRLTGAGIQVFAATPM
jgi:circadian clock protein KaiC